MHCCAAKLMAVSSAPAANQGKIATIRTRSAFQLQNKATHVVATHQPPSAGWTAGARPLARYFPKDNLVFYFEFSGVDAHADAWNKTAAYKMLTETPLGAMLEEVGAQLMDKMLSYSPGHRLDGKDYVALI